MSLREFRLRIAACLNVSDYKACDEIKDSVIQLKTTRGELQAEQKRLMTSTRKSKWYYQRKMDESKSSVTSSDIQTPSPSPFESSSEFSTSSPVQAFSDKSPFLPIQDSDDECFIHDEDIQCIGQTLLPATPTEAHSKSSSTTPTAMSLVSIPTTIIPSRMSPSITPPTIAGTLPTISPPTVVASTSSSTHSVSMSPSGTPIAIASVSSTSPIVASTSSDVPITTAGMSSTPPILTNGTYTFLHP